MYVCRSHKTTNVALIRRRFCSCYFVIHNLLNGFEIDSFYFVLNIVTSWFPISLPIIFSSFFFFSKKLPIVVVRDVCPSVCPSVRLSVRLSVRPSVEIISFRGNSLSNRPIELKIGLNVREGVVHVRKAWFFEMLIASCKFMQFAFFCK